MKILVWIFQIIFLTSCWISHQEINIVEKWIKIEEEKTILNDTIIHEEKIVVDEFANYKLLSKYYNLISEGQLEEAYLLKYKPSITLEQFKNSYQLEIGEWLYISKYKKLSENQSSFEVWDMIEPNINFIIYNVTAKIIDEKIHILETKKITHKTIDEFVFEWWKLTSEWEKWIKNLYIDTNNTKKLILSKNIYFHNWRYDIPSYWSNFHSFSIKNKHIIKFIKPEWEMGGYYEYDIYTDILTKVSYDDFYEEN